MQKEVQDDTVAWDNTKIFESLDSVEVSNTTAKIVKEIDAIKIDCEIYLEYTAETKEFSIPKDKQDELVERVTRTSLKRREIQVLIWDLRTFCRSELSINSKNSKAKAVIYECEKLTSQFYQSIEALNLFLIFVNDNFINAYLELKENRGEAFRLKNMRDKRDFTLPLEQENLVKELATDGFHAWDTLYETISGSILCPIRNAKNEIVDSIGFATAYNKLASKDDAERKSSYLAIEEAWKTQEESCASVLNSLTGWRKKEDGLRSKKRKLHFLEPSLRDARLSKASLNSMMSVVEESRVLSQRAVSMTAKILGKSKMDPWDRRAGFELDEKTSLFSFDDSIQEIREACGSLHPEVDEFIQIMEKNHWIDARMGDNRLPGAYCTKFLAEKAPRVFMTFSGTAVDVKTLGHELGHAFHNWKIRDLTIDEHWYPMTLAETASTFFENLILNHWASGSIEKKKLSYWQQLQSVLGYLVDIPMRFDFEYKLYEQSGDKKLNPNEITGLLKESWLKYYGHTVSGIDETYWMSKLHFYLSGIRFYNYPYTFGFLFSMGILAKQKEMGDQFYTNYINLLRDCGRKSCEEIAMEYLNEDLTKPDFWRKSMGIIEEQINGAESVFFSS